MESVFIEFLKAAVLAIIEGITEWLPISSTGHMILAQEFIHLNMSAQYKEMFFVVVQLGAILAVAVLFFARLNPFSIIDKKISIKKETLTLWFKIIAACLPAAICGLLWDDKFNELFYNYQTVAIMLILVGIAFIVVESFVKDENAKIKNVYQITYKIAFIIGLFQLVSAIFPGTSRSGATIIGALIFGVCRTAATEFTFFLAVPVMFGASALKLFKFGLNFTGVELSMLLFSMACAFIISALTMNFLLSYVKKHDFKFFGYYRIVLG
ncbi:MAG: undecaprenyl-diphosphate phosphatase, partial [Elusimicrobiota bacterium]|nr:undecaprenyl-diphosphate phosphatase [Elusimicrobiota bacterium]